MQLVIVTVVVTIAFVVRDAEVDAGGVAAPRAAVAAHAARRWGLSAANARRVEAKLATGGACGSCETCKACASPAVQPGDATPVAYRTIAIHRATSPR